jgi:5-methylcytosine-specific restriction endonuclease McrA
MAAYLCPLHVICMDCGRTVDAVRRGRCQSCFAVAAKRTNNWTGKATPARVAHQTFITSSAWRKVAREVKARDGFTCTECGTDRKLTVHHLIPVRTAPHLALEHDNCVTLCSSCHGRHETKGGVAPMRGGAGAAIRN